MLTKWPIRNKLFVGLALLVVIVSILSWSAFYGLYGYRNLAKSLERVTELRYASELNQHVSDLRVSLSRIHGLSSQEAWYTSFQAEPPATLQLVREEFRQELGAVKASLETYHLQLQRHDRVHLGIGDNGNEHDTVRQIEDMLIRIDRVNNDADWVLDQVKLGQLENELELLQSLTARLPGFLHENIHTFTDEVRDQRRTFVGIAWTTSTAALGMMGLFVWLVYKWVFRPLRVLIKGSRKIAAGCFHYRIRLDTHDEMSELAEALNDMTARFQAIRDDLDCQVRQRTRQVVRSEQLASVGFLAAGVAHEINNPLASIAMCAESLEARTADLLSGDDPNNDVIRTYLRMIQDEAFRCKGITGKLLDFSRSDDVKRQPVELRDIVQGVIDMVGHLGKYQGKRIDFRPGEPVMAEVNSQEIKQVVLNLVTNALESIDDDGQVTIDLVEERDRAVLTIADNGCGMTEEVQQHLFEPFFTRRRHGQGTGLGLSITYRIVEEHGGQIDVASEGPGCGSRFRISLPQISDAEEKETSHRYQAA